MGSQDRNAWIRAGLRRLGEEGIAGVRVEPLAKQLGVTKGSFYWHFRDRSDLHAAMLAEWRLSATEAVIERSESAGNESAARLERLVEIASDGFDGQTELALRTWARGDRRVSRAVEEVDSRRLGYLRRLLRESGFEGASADARAFLIYSMLFGDYLLPRAHGRFSRKRVLRECLAILR